MSTVKSYTRLLTIAGSDSGGGAGIQADLKTFAACGCYGMSAVTAVTAQNTLGVVEIEPIPVPMIIAQIRAVLSDIGVDAIKVGMLPSGEAIAAVAGLLREYGCRRVVVDPVMVSTSGKALMAEEGMVALRESLFGAAGLITPNLPEAERLLGRAIGPDAGQDEAACDLAAACGVPVLLKGGHLCGDRLRDVLASGQTAGIREFPSSRLATANTHGTGCTLSSAIAAFWGRGLPLVEAVGRAEAYLHRALAAGSGYVLGRGHGPVHHFHEFWQ